MPTEGSLANTSVVQAESGIQNGNDYVRRDSLLSHLVNIPVYTGTDPNFSLSKFKTKFAEIAQFLNWTTDERYFAVQQRLAGQAQTVLLNFRDEIKSEDDIFRILGSRFEAKKDNATLLSNFWNLKQDGMMPVGEFVAIARSKVKEIIAFQKIPVSAKTQIEEDWLLAMLLQNLRPELRRPIIARNPVTVKELIDLAILEEKACCAVKNDCPPLVNEPVGVACVLERQNKNEILKQNENDQILLELKNSINLLTDKVKEMNLKTNDSQTQSNAQIQCFGCSEWGHRRENCPFLNSYNTFIPQQNFTEHSRNQYRAPSQQHFRGQYYQSPAQPYDNARTNSYRFPSHHSRGNYIQNTGHGFQGRGTGYRVHSRGNRYNARVFRPSHPRGTQNFRGGTQNVSGERTHVQFQDNSGNRDETSNQSRGHSPFRGNRHLNSRRPR